MSRHRHAGAGSSISCPVPWSKLGSGHQPELGAILCSFQACPVQRKPSGISGGFSQREGTATTRICSHHGTAGTLQHSTAGGFWCRDPHHGSKSLIPHVLRAIRQRCPLLQHRFPHSAPAPGIPTHSRWSIPGGRIPQLRMPGCSSSAGQPTRSGSARQLPPKFLICSQINYYLITAPGSRDQMFICTAWLQDQPYSVGVGFCGQGGADRAEGIPGG